MLKLLKVEIKTLFKWKATKYTIFFLLLFAALLGGMNVLNEEMAMSGIFTFPTIVLFIISAIGGLFTYQDYSQNTIRNKIVVGHSRLEVYLAKTVTVLILHVTLVTVSMLIMGVIGCAYLDTEYVVWEAFWKNCIIVLSSTVVVSAFTSMISINIKSPLGALLPMIFVYALFIGGMFGMEMLYINEAKNAIKIMQAIPIICLINLSETIIPENMWSVITTSLAVIVGCVMFGYLMFRKADLK